MTEALPTGVRDKIWSAVAEILDGDDSGHGMDHIRRVHGMAISFADRVDESVDRVVVELSALLHDVDDYKLVGREQAERLTNASKVMDSIGVDSETQAAVREVIANMGYSNSLRGIRPITIEGEVVSDADMCDAIGASGIVRALEYAVSSKGSGVVFDRTVWPIINITAEQYNSSGSSHETDSFINHFFEKLLWLKGMMLTEPGRREAEVRDQQMVEFLRAFFREEKASDWEDLLERFIVERKSLAGGPSE